MTEHTHFIRPDGEPNDEPPHHIEAEQQLLGAILLDGARIDLIGGTVTKEHFYDPVHAEIFERIRVRWKMNRPVGVFALKDWADQHEGIRELGGPTYLAKLAASCVTTVNFKEIATIIRDVAEKRDLLLKLQDGIKALKDDGTTAADVSGRLEAHLMSSQTTSVGNRPVSMMKAVTTSLERLKAAQDGEPTGELQSGIPALDKLIGGFNPGEFWILAGRPSMGKTAVAISISTRMANAGHGVCFNSREMMADALADRAISERSAQIGNGAAVPYSTFSRGGLPEYQFRAAVQAGADLAELPLYILDTGYADVGSMIAGAKHVRTLLGPNIGLKAIFVDYIGLLKGGNAREGRQFQVAEISQDLKEMAKRLEVPVICLAQLNRQVEQRDDKRPMLSDLRDSGQIEQDADGVIFCYREEYYLEREKDAHVKKGKLEEWQAAMDAVRNNLELIVAKQRQGPIGTAHVRMNPALNHIWEG